MPTYSYQCAECGEDATKINRIAERKTNAPYCSKCKKNSVLGKRKPIQMVQTITPISTPMINSTSAKHFDNYICPITDAVVTSARQKKEIEAANGLIIKEKGIFPPRKKKEKPPELPKELQKEMKHQIKKQKQAHQPRG